MRHCRLSQSGEEAVGTVISANRFLDYLPAVVYDESAQKKGAPE
jgi:hypothetical protein